jgi:glutathione S-transferase
MHQVPALAHDGFSLSEAAAIMFYLSDLNGVGDQWVGPDSRRRSKTHQYLSWHHSNTRSAVTLDYFLPCLLMPAYWFCPPFVDT